MKRDISRLQKTIASPYDGKIGRLEISPDGKCTEFTVKDIPYSGFKGEHGKYETGNENVSRKKKPTLGKTARVKKKGKENAIALDPMKELLKEKKESVVNTEVDDLLNLYHIYHWRNNTGSYKKKGRYISYGKPGSSDWLGICDDGRFLAIEDKRPVGGKLSKLQRDFLDNVNRRGGVGIYVTSAADCLAQLREAGVIK